MKYLTRRKVLGYGALGGIACGVARFGLGTRDLHAAGKGLQVTPLRNNRFLLSNDQASVLVLPGTDSPLLVGGLPPGNGDALLSALAEQGHSAPQVLYNTHWHWDQTGTNETLAAEGARIISHENTRLWLTNEFYVDWQDRHYEPRPEAALPDETFYQEHTLRFGDENIHSALLFQAHTDGDIYVHCQDSNILAVGDLATVGTFPLVDPVTGGWIGGLTDAQARLLELADDDTLIIPGSGGVLSREDLSRQHDMLVTMRERIFEFVRQGKGPREMLEAGVAEGYEDWGDPTQFVLNIYPGLGPHYRDIDGVV